MHSQPRIFTPGLVKPRDNVTDYHTFVTPDIDTLVTPDIDSLVTPDIDTLVTPDIDTLVTPDIDTLLTPDIDTLVNPGLVKPRDKVTDYRTHVSGIRPADVANGVACLYILFFSFIFWIFIFWNFFIIGILSGYADILVRGY